MLGGGNKTVKDRVAGGIKKWESQCCGLNIDVQKSRFEYIYILIVMPILLITLITVYIILVVRLRNTIKKDLGKNKEKII